jgi:hypothetical protein
MNIELDIKYNPVRAEQIKMVQWKLLKRPKLVSMGILLMLSLGLFLLKETVFGNISLIVFFFYLQYYLGSRKDFFSNWIHNGLSMQLPGNSYMKLDDSTINYANAEMKLAMKWSGFTHYTIRDNFLILIKENMSVSFLTIDLTEMTQDQREEVISIVKKHLLLKRGLFY